VVTALPTFYTTVWIGGAPYYYANDVYYRWAPEQNAYEVVDPPQGADQPGVTPQAGAEDFYLYPKRVVRRRSNSRPIVMNATAGLRVKLVLIRLRRTGECPPTRRLPSATSIDVR
jgi:hypothetical protein